MSFLTDLGQMLTSLSPRSPRNIKSKRKLPQYCIFLPDNRFLPFVVGISMERRMTLPAPGYHPYHTTLNFVLSDFLGAGILAHVKRCLWAGAVDEDLAHHLREKTQRRLSLKLLPQARSPSTVFYKHLWKRSI